MGVANAARKNMPRPAAQTMFFNGTTKSRQFAITTMAQFTESGTRPQSLMEIFATVLPLCDPSASTFLTMSMPESTWPNTTCFLSSQLVTTVVTKNCDPLVPGP